MSKSENGVFGDGVNVVDFGKLDDTSNRVGSRRAFIKFGGSALALAALPPLSVGAFAAQSEIETVNEAFSGLVDSLATGDLDSFYGRMDDQFVMIDEDIPFRLSKEEFQDHIGFHVSGVWDSFSWSPESVRFLDMPGGGIVAGSAVFKGKPRDAGFRIRPLLFSQTWVAGSDGRLRLCLWHQSPLAGRLTGGSPS